MASIHLQIAVVKDDPGLLKSFVDNLKDKTALYARIAGDAENEVKQYGRVVSANEHKTASGLGAKPTGHLARAYEGIEVQSTAEGASMLVLRATRLRAAFGAYTITPNKPDGYLTIPVKAESYGRRAGEFNDLFFLFRGKNRSPVLARRPEKGVKKTPLEVLYVLTRKSDIKEDRNLIPFDLLEAGAVDSVLDYFAEIRVSHMEGNG